MAEENSAAAQTKNTQGGSSSIQNAGSNLVISSAISDINQEFKEREIQQKAREMGINYIDISLVPINPDNLALITPEDSKKGKIIVFFRVGQKLRVALVNPENLETKQVLEELKRRHFVLNLNLCSEESLARAQKLYQTNYRAKKEIIAEVREENVANVQAAISSLEEMPTALAKMKTDEALNVLHQQVLRMGVSDLHFEPQEKGYIVRARIDGILSKFFVIPGDSTLSENLIKQIKYNAHLKLNITNLPQDGQYFFKANDRMIDVRVSTLPTRRGESIVLRFLDPKRGIVPLANLGFSQYATQKIESVLENRNGLILVTGPTGSGKTTTLYSILQKINAPEKKIVTLEDPVEYHLQGLLQSQIDEAGGYTFATGLRSVLRQDPDVVMVGEIRDLETAETAVQASLTGHLVLSTLHTNSAVDAIPRFLNMGVKSYILAPALRAIVAQRLIRRVCPDCAKEREMTAAEKEEIFAVLKAMSDRGQKIEAVSPHIKEAVGCDKCSKSGYRGEMAIGEVLLFDDQMRTAIFEGATTKEILTIAEKNGFRDMWEEVILAVINGETTLSEAKRGVGR